MQCMSLLLVTNALMHCTGLHSDYTKTIIWRTNKRLVNSVIGRRKSLLLRKVWCPYFTNFGRRRDHLWKSLNHESIWSPLRASIERNWSSAGSRCTKNGGEWDFSRDIHQTQSCNVDVRKGLSVSSSRIRMSIRITITILIAIPLYGLKHCCRRQVLQRRFILHQVLQWLVKLRSRINHR